jgi:hypothetical protein
MGVVISVLGGGGRRGFYLNPSVKSHPSDVEQFKCRLVAKHQKIGEHSRDGVTRSLADAHSGSFYICNDLLIDWVLV